MTLTERALDRRGEPRSEVLRVGPRAHRLRAVLAGVDVDVLRVEVDAGHRGSVFHWLKRRGERANRRQGEQLFEAVRAALPDADDTHVRIVGATAALLLCVAYADHEYAPEEETQLRETLSAIEGLDRDGVDAIVGVLREHVVHIVAAEATSYARELLELTADDFRLQLLDLLVDVAAADGVVTVAETNTLRVAAKALGLTGAQYNASQARHRDKLGVLR